jgi:hypothetical protein
MEPVLRMGSIFYISRHSYYAENHILAVPSSDIQITPKGV